MRLLSVIAAIVLSVLPASFARAQAVSVYGTFSDPHFSSVETGQVTTAASTQLQYTSFWAPGIGGGVTFNFPPLGPLKLGLDVRGSTKKGTNGADTLMVGLKAGFKLPVLAMKPYIQVSGGYMGTRTQDVSVYLGTHASDTFNNQYIAYEVIGGLDYPLIRFLDLRLIEAGGGSGFSVGQTSNDFGVNSNHQQITIFTINTGVVAHF